MTDILLKNFQKNETSECDASSFWVLGEMTMDLALIYRSLGFLY